MGCLIIIVSAGYSRLALTEVFFGVSSVPRSEIRRQSGYLGVDPQCR
jgi:hypothetical protein